MTFLRGLDPPPILILCGGVGSRLKALTFDKPKCLIRVHHETFLFFQISNFSNIGFSKFVLCVHHLSDLIQLECNRISNKLDVEIEVLDDGARALGTGGAIINALKTLPDYFYVTNGDSFLPFDLGRFTKKSYNERKNFMTVARPPNLLDANLQIIGDEIIGYSKKGGSQLNFIDYGFLGLNKSALKHFKKQTFFDAGELYSELIADKRIRPYFVDEPYFDVGSYCGYSSLLTYVSR